MSYPTPRRLLVHMANFTKYQTTQPTGHAIFPNYPPVYMHVYQFDWLKYLQTDSNHQFSTMIQCHMQQGVAQIAPFTRFFNDH